MYEKPANSQELSDLIAELEMKSLSQKEDIKNSAALLMYNLKPINLLKSALQPVSNGFIGKWVGKAVLGYKKLLHRPTDSKKPLLISKY